MNARQRKFAHEYVRNGFNGVQAILAAGYRMGYNSACVEASRNLRKPKVMAVIENHLKSTKMDADEVLTELTDVARSETKISDSSKVKALELLGKAHKLFIDKIEQQSVADPTTTRVALLRRISKIAAKTGDTQHDVERELQAELADQSDEDYSPELDARLHPELWPSGNLLSTAVVDGGEQ